MATASHRKPSNRAARGGSLGGNNSQNSSRHQMSNEIHRGDSEFEDNPTGWGSDPEGYSIPGQKKGRERKYFEEELRALQDDITMLSRKLSLPIPTESSRGRPAARGRSGGGDDPRRVIGDYNRDSGRNGANKSLRNSYESDPIDQLTDRNYTESESDHPEHPKGQLIRLQKQVRQLTHERDDANYQITQLQTENQHLKQLNEDRNQLKATCEHLLREVESLKVSLQSSETIRKQQKELLAVFQRSQQLMDSSRHNSMPHLHYSADDGSISSGNGGTSIHSRSSYITSTPTPTQPSILSMMSAPAHGLSSPAPDHHQEKTPTSMKKMTRKKSTPSPPTSGGKSMTSSQVTPRNKPTKSSPTQNSTPRTPKFTTRSFAPSSDSDTSSRHSSSRYSTGVPGSGSRSMGTLRTPPSQPSRPPLVPHSASSTHTHHIPSGQSPVGTNKVKSRPQSAPPTRPRGSFLHNYHSSVTPSPSSRRDRRL